MVEEFISSDDKYELESSQEKKTTLINKLLNEHEYDKITKEIDDVLNKNTEIKISDEIKATKEIIKKAEDK